MLEARGWVFTAAVVDGRRGLANVFKDIPVQVCQFHQLQTVTKYLTRRPKTEAGKELKNELQRAHGKQKSLVRRGGQALKDMMRFGK